MNILPRTLKLLFTLSVATMTFSSALSPIAATAQRLPQVVVPNHYSLTVTPNLTAATFTGEEQIDVLVQIPVDAITLNAAEIKFTSVTAIVDGKKLQATVTLDDKKEQATFSFAKQIRAGHVTLVIEYSGILNDQLRGFYLSKTAKRNYAVTQFEATDARRAFPCFDEPAMKATYDVTLIIDKDDTAISNTKIIADKPGPLAGQHTIQFATTPKMSTYLLAFLVGDFECVSGESDGVPIRACGTPGNAQMGKYAVTSAEYFLHYYDQYFGIKYPMPKLDMIALPDFEAGAMENFGAITYRETDLLIDEKTASIGQKQRVAVVVAHEMAHQWFGDMVTMQWWNNVWLNEGFATWMENKAVANWKPQWHMSQSVAADLQETMDLDARAQTRTIRAEAETPAQINEMFDGIAYGKAGAVLNMMENYEGEETFRRGVHDYLAAHLYANATAEDFWNTQASVSHKPADEIMKSFVTEPGVPLLTFTAPHGGSVTIAQQRFFLTPVATQTPQSWTLPVCLAAAATPCSVVSASHPEISVAGSKLFFANGGGKGYYRSKYPAEDYAKIVAAVESALSPEERISLLGDEMALMHANIEPVGDYLDLVSAVKNDDSNYVIDRATGGVGRIKALIASDDQQRAAMEHWIDKTFGPVLERLGEPTPGEPAQKSQLRLSLFTELGEQGRDPAVIANARKIAAQYLVEPQSVDTTLAPAAIEIAARNGDASFFDQLQKTYESSPDPHIKSTSLRALAGFRAPALEARALDYAVSGKVRNQDSAGLIGRMLADQETRDIAWAYLQANWNKVSAQMTKWGGGGLVRGAGSFCSPEARDQVSAFFATHKVEASERALKSAVGSINDCIALRAAQGPALKDWLAKQN